MSSPEPVDLIKVDVVVVADKLVPVVLSRVQEVKQGSNLPSGGTLNADLLIALALNFPRSSETDTVRLPFEEVIDGVLGDHLSIVIAEQNAVRLFLLLKESSEGPPALCRRTLRDDITGQQNQIRPLRADHLPENLVGAWGID